MDRTDKKSCKGVRLQGFKGFKLKSTQILRKNNFSKTKFSEDALNKKAITKTLPTVARYDFISLKDVAHNSTISNTGNDEKELESKVVVQVDRAKLSHDIKVEPIRGVVVANCRVLVQSKSAVKQSEKRDNSCSNSNEHANKAFKRVLENCEESISSKKARGNEHLPASVNNDKRHSDEVVKCKKLSEQCASFGDIVKEEDHVVNSAVCSENTAVMTKLQYTEKCNTSPSIEISSPLKQEEDATDMKLADLKTSAKSKIEINANCVAPSKNHSSINSKAAAFENVESRSIINPYQDIDDVLPIKLSTHCGSTATDTNKNFSCDKLDKTTIPFKNYASSNSVSEVVENNDRLVSSENTDEINSRIKSQSVCHKTTIGVNGVLSNAAHCYITATQNNTTVDAVTSQHLGTISSERDKLAYPAKKRYHEWFKNKSEKEISSAKPELFHCDAASVLTSNSPPTSSPATETDCNTESREKHLDPLDFIPQYCDQNTGACEEARDSVRASNVFLSSMTVLDHAVDTPPQLHLSESSSVLFSPLKVPTCGAANQTAVEESEPSQPVLTSCFSTTSDPPCVFNETSPKHSVRNVRSPEHSLDMIEYPEHSIKDAAKPAEHLCKEALVSASKLSTDSLATPMKETNSNESNVKAASLSPQRSSSSPSRHQNHFVELRTDSSSPLISAEVMSPVMDYTLSDTSSLAGSLSPIDIRIPVDNCELTDDALQPEKYPIADKDDDQKELTDAPDSKQCDATKTVTENEVTSSFTLIEENIYLFQKKKSRARKEIRRMLCECFNNIEEPPCGENCLNRLLMIECSARCPFGELCTNKRFQRREYLRTEVFQTSWKGRGLRAAADLPPGQLVMEYCGEVLDAVEFYRRSQLYAESRQQHFYFMALSQDEIIDATYKGNISRFINHSCKPNCETQKWTVNGRLCVGIFTINEVKAGEEITFDYQFESYGKERQKCYCGASTCRGFLGKATNYTSVPREKIVEGVAEDERKVVKEFKESSVENELNRLVNGLQTTKEVLLLCRLMVRCESVNERTLCLKVLRRTSSQASLKAFLHFHGLSLMWSWMVDLGGASQLKAEILSTLAILPISNKNVLEDSKVLPMVVRWSEGESTSLQTTDSQDDVTSNVDDSDASRLDNSAKENKELEQKILSLSLSLLTVWKNLKEIYRIPKRTKLVETTEGAQSEEDLSSSKISSPSKQCHSQEKATTHDRRSELKHRHSPVRSRARDDDVRSSKHDSASRFEIRLTREEHRKQFEREMRLRKEKQEHNKQRKHKKSSSDTPPTTPSTPQTVTSTAPSTPQTVASTPDSFTPAGYSGNLIQITPDPAFASAIPPQQASSYLDPCTQGQPISVIGASTTDQALLPPAQSTLLSAPYNYQNTPQLPSADSFGVTILGYDGPNVIVSLSPDQLKELTDLLAFKSLQQATLQQPLLSQLPLTAPVQPVAALPMQPVAPLPTLPPTPLPAQPVTPLPTEPSTPDLTQPVQTTKVPLVQTTTTTPQSAHSETPSQVQTAVVTNEVVPTPTSTSSSDAGKSPARDPRPTRLPPNWKTASDADGCVYYYHVITRQTQWDPPTWDAPAEDMAGRKEGEMELSTPTAEDKNASSSAPATSATSSDSAQARKAKEAFRSRMSQHIVTCLSAYRKQDCKVGRILNNEDFKKLARKLTYNVLMKEIKQVQVWEDLECNANVKHKAKEYVRKYMAKMGPVYRAKEEVR